MDPKVTRICDPVQTQLQGLIQPGYQDEDKRGSGQKTQQLDLADGQKGQASLVIDAYPCSNDDDGNVDSGLEGVGNVEHAFV